MKIWITRSSAFSIQCGGLDRLFVWFREPVYRYVIKKEGLVYGNQFDEPTIKAGCIERAGWEVPCTGNTWITNSVSFAKLFGYGDRDEDGENQLAEYVWKQVEHHFGNTDFNDWHNYEKQNIECQVKNFLIEIELNIKPLKIKQ